MAFVNSVPRGYLVCFLIAAAFSGCGRRNNPDEAIARVNSTNMQRLANLYMTYQMKNAWQGPADEAEFKKFISSYSPKKLTRIGIDPNAINELFVNERDGQPFKIRFSVAGSAMGSSEPVIFESVGVNQRRMVGFLDMRQREVDEAEYHDLWAGTTQPARPRADDPTAR